MRFLQINEIWQWCAERGIPLVNDARDLDPDHAIMPHHPLFAGQAEAELRNLRFERCRIGAGARRRAGSAPAFMRS
jgi:hypothetical protein